MSKTPSDPAAGWTGHTFADRVQNCRMFLYLYGYLTAAQNDAVRAKMVKRGTVPPECWVGEPVPPGPRAKEGRL